MRYALLTLILVSVQASGADFRGLKFGQSCDGISAIEENLGSKHAAWTRPDPENFHTFSGWAFGREVWIAYLCKDGKFETGHYYFPVETRDASISSFRFMYDQLTVLYGEPFVGGPPWQEEQNAQDSRAGVDELSDYYVSWRTAPVYAILTLMPSPDGATNRRSVFVVIRQYRP